MKLADYWKTLPPEAKKSLADAVGTSVAYMSHMANGIKGISAERATVIETATGGKVSRLELLYPHEDFQAVANG